MRKFLSTGLLVSAIIASAHASLIGTTVTLKYFYPNAANLFSTDNITVTNSVEVLCAGTGAGNANVCGVLTAPVQNLDFQASAITYTYTGPGTAFNNSADFNGFAFQDLAYGGGISGITLSTNIPGLNASRVSFTANSVSVNMESLALPGPARFFTLSLLPEITERIPEPRSVFLFLGALPLLLLRRR